MLDVCLGTVSVGSRSILNQLFSLFSILENQHSDVRGVRLIKSVGNAFLGGCSQGIHPLSTGTVLLFASLCLSFCVSLSFFCLLSMSLSLPLSLSLSLSLCPSVVFAPLPRTVYLVITLSHTSMTSQKQIFFF